ncbi:putative transmembrane protein [Heterostelium album PN500]|uniref:Putative transmembrane protein n=1 Tax=Heterostelium pallidum (strain ATCC 26659 / Pp 5 / PN500) TaxID=670386 RepID=D3BDY5_HETP5|nr:putative transmembrane protein [Heterostelium album PN500]EFA80116.1 putative transmembrane protein [Heterostelium album PN500]|eukprot:XP_020432236.1 putative transmembrane protein [Heterostelium album PN500]
MSKIINRENNLTKSDPELLKYQTPILEHHQTSPGDIRSNEVVGANNSIYNNSNNNNGSSMATSRTNLISDLNRNNNNNDTSTNQPNFDKDGVDMVTFSNNSNNNSNNNNSNNNNNNNNNNSLSVPQQQQQTKFISPLSRVQELQVVILNEHESSLDPGDPPPSDDEDESIRDKKKKKKLKNLLSSYKARTYIVVGIVLGCIYIGLSGVELGSRWIFFVVPNYTVSTAARVLLCQWYYIPTERTGMGGSFIFHCGANASASIAIIFVALFYCGRVALVKILAAKTNRKAFYSSLKASLLNEELLEQMSTRKAKTLGQSVSASLKRKKQISVAQWIETLKTRNNLSGKLQARASEFTQKESKKIAKQIIKNAGRGKDYLVKDDLNAYVKPKHLDKAFNTFGSLNDEKISRDDIVNWVMRVVRSRKTLEYRLRDHEDIGQVINDIINFIFWILMFLFVLSLYGVDISAFLVPLSTTILALSFAFGTTLRNIFESLILIFFVRPFEVGDKIAINEEVLFVDRIGILFTSFKSLDGKAVYVPNQNLLTARKIENHQRSEEVWIGVDLLINFMTPVEKLYILEAKIDKWMKAQPEKWKNDLSLNFVEIRGTNHILVRYGASIISTWQDVKRWRPVKNELFFKMKEWLADLGFDSLPARQLVQMVNGPQITPLMDPSSFNNFNNNSNNNNQFPHFR